MFLILPLLPKFLNCSEYCPLNVYCQLLLHWNKQKLQFAIIISLRKAMFWLYCLYNECFSLENHIQTPNTEIFIVCFNNMSGILNNMLPWHWWEIQFSIWMSPCIQALLLMFVISKLLFHRCNSSACIVVYCYRSTNEVVTMLIVGCFNVDSMVISGMKIN